MVTETRIATNLCRSCGEGFEARVASLIICSACVARREQVKRMLTVINPITTSAKRFADAIPDAISNRKFVSAQELIKELHLQVLSDRDEAEARKQRDRDKKERWASRQGVRRINDQATRSRMRGNK